MYRKFVVLLIILLMSSLALSQVMAQTVAQDVPPPVATEDVPAPAATEESAGEGAGAAGDAPEMTEVATGLNNPRNIFLAADGTLYIAEAGVGGDQDAIGPFGPAKAGQTGQISAVSSDGEQTVVVSDIVSMDAGFGQVEGVMGVYVTDESLWVVYGLGPQGEDNPFPDGLVEAVVEHDLETLEVKQTIDLRAFEAENNPDASMEIVSNPADMAVAEDGTIYIADASGNSVIKWTADGGAELFAAWIVDEVGSAVPTAVAIGPDGDLYVGFLSGFPYAPGTARVERFGVDGVLKETYGGLTLVVDLVVTEDGTVYALEMASGYGDTGFVPDSGRIVIVSADGVTPVVEGLNIPYGMAQDAQGNWLVTVNSAFQAPDSGAVVSLNAGE
jgi:hypothetical protein